MPGGKTAGKSGAAGESILGTHLKALGFYCFDVWSKYRNAVRDGKSLPDRFAVSQMRYESRYRPNTDCRMDWGVFVNNELILHIESKVQGTTGSTSAKAVAAADELADQILQKPNLSCYLVLPHEDTLDSLPNCDADYFRWAKRKCDRSQLELFAGDIGACIAFLTRRYRIAKRIIEI